MIGLQVELLEGGEELGDGAHALVGHVDAIVDRERDEPGVEARPESLLRDLVATGDLQPDETLQELHERLETPIADVAASQNQPLDARRTVREVLDEVEDVRVVGIEEAEGVEAAHLERGEVVVLHDLRPLMMEVGVEPGGGAGSRPVGVLAARRRGQEGGGGRDLGGRVGLVGIGVQLAPLARREAVRRDRLVGDGGRCRRHARRSRRRRPGADRATVYHRPHLCPELGLIEDFAPFLAYLSQG